MKSILVVDDSESFREQLKADLEQAGHKVTEAKDGADGLQVVRDQAQPFDLIICDLNMPNLDGMGMCRSLHSEGLLEGVCVFILTTEVDASMKGRRKLLACGLGSQSHTTVKNFWQ